MHIDKMKEWLHSVTGIRFIEDGEPCSHKGCQSHLTHPCERCGRVGGKRKLNLVKFIGGPKDGQTVAMKELPTELRFQAFPDPDTRVHFPNGRALLGEGWHVYHLRHTTDGPYYQY